MTARRLIPGPASERLTLALVVLASHGDRPPCGDYGGHALWLSEDPVERQVAAAWCSGCPVLTECDQAAEETGERFGVWAGVDRTLSNRAQTRGAS